MNRISRRIWIVVGRVGYYLTYPLLAVALRFNSRTRVVVQCGEQTILIKTWLFKNWWDLPGGGLHRNENPSAGAARELNEEVGITSMSGELEYLYTAPYKAGLIRFNIHYFRYVLSEKPSLKLQRGEVIEAGWFTRVEIQEMKLHPSLKTAVGVL